MDKLLGFIIASDFLALFSFLKKGKRTPTLFVVKVVKAWSMGEPILIMLVSKDTVATRAYVSYSPTSYTQSLFPQT